MVRVRIGCGFSVSNDHLATQPPSINLKCCLYLFTLCVSYFITSFFFVSWLTMMKHLGLSLLGLPELDSFSSVDSPSVFLVEILYSLFLIIGAILLVNMLIALLSNTYQSVEVIVN